MKKLIIICLCFVLLTACGKKDNTSNIDDNKQEDASSEVFDNDLLDEDINEESKDDKLEESDNTIIGINNSGNEQKEEEIVNYFTNLKENIKSRVNGDTWDNVKMSVKDMLNKAYGFCFKNEEINGYTFSELSESTKEKILNIVSDIDIFIEGKIPGYKDSVKEGYDSLIDTTKESVNIVKDKLKDFFSEK